MRAFGRSLLVMAFVGLLVSASAQAAFPGANGRIFFPYSGSTTWTMNPDGSDASQLSAQRVAGRWSADGTMTVRENEFGTSPADFTVWSADGTKVTDLSVPDTGHNPSWTPDGRILYDAERATCYTDPFGGTYCDSQALGVWVVNLDGTQSHKIVDDAAMPISSPDGTKLAFLREVGSSAGLFVANADGSGAVPVATGTFDVYDGGADWSPDGRRIAFVRIFCAAAGNCAWDLWSVAADGTDERRLTSTANQERSFSWSPDGRKIVVSEYDPSLSSALGMFTLNAADGSGLTQIFGQGGPPFWRPLVNRRPDCSQVRASPGSVWPPNRKLVTVTLDGASDPDGDAVSLVVTSVSSDPPAGASDARVGPAANQARVRSVRGRTYEIAFDVGDDAGAHCFGATSVAVSHG